MYCVKCGHPLHDEANFCAYCGIKAFRPEPAEKLDEVPQVQNVPEPQISAYQAIPAAAAIPAPYESRMSLAALACGILSICLFWAVVPGFALGLTAVVFGVRSTSKYPDVQKGQAVAGFILGITAIALSAFMLFQFFGSGISHSFGQANINHL